MAKRLFTVVVGALALNGLAWGHALQVTGVTLRLEKRRTEVTVVAHLPTLAGADPGRAIPARLRVELDGQAFRATKSDWERDAAQDTVIWVGTEERGAASAVVAAPLFPDRPEETTVVLVYREGALVDRAALNASHRSAVLGEATGEVLRRFFRMGVTHILTGPDHLLFLVGLILVGGAARRIFAVITAFTLAHSITLSLTALGWASLPPRVVEPLIALSIVVVGVENLLERQAGFAFRVWVAFGFGFFHGFGFAGALAEVGLPRQALGWSLAAFNLGVEVGQAAVLALALPALGLLQRRSERASGLVQRAVSVGIVVAGVVWFVERI